MSSLYINLCSRNSDNSYIRCLLSGLFAFFNLVQHETSKTFGKFQEERGERISEQVAFLFFLNPLPAASRTFCKRYFPRLSDIFFRRCWQCAEALMAAHQKRQRRRTTKNQKGGKPLREAFQIAKPWERRWTFVAAMKAHRELLQVIKISKKLESRIVVSPPFQRGFGRKMETKAKVSKILPPKERPWGNMETFFFSSW